MTEILKGHIMQNHAPHLFTFILLVICTSGTLAVTDPYAVLEYSTYLGPRSDYVFYTNYMGIGVDKEGRVYVSTSLAKEGFPTTSDAMQKNRSEIAISKLSADGSELIYSSFFGPPDTWTRAYDMTVDERGYAYLVGITNSKDFPATPGAYHPDPIGPFPRPYAHDGFLVKLDPTLKQVIYGTYIGNNNWDEVFTVAVDSQGQAILGGDVGDKTRTVYKFRADGSGLVFEHGPLGQGKEGLGLIFDITTDAHDNAYVLGFTVRDYFITTPGAYDRQFRSKGRCHFLRKLDPAGNIVFSTFLKHSTRGSGEDHFYGNSLAVDAQGCVYICRATEYAREETTAQAFDPTYNGKYDVYVLKLDPTGSHAIWATYLGGKRDDKSKNLTLDAQGNVYVVGRTQSTDFPTTETALDRDHNGDYDMFLTVLDAEEGRLRYSTLMGGKDYDTGQELVLDQYNNLYIAGTTRSIDFPSTEGAHRRTHSGYQTKKFGGDVFVMKLDMGTMVRTVTNLNTGAEYANLQPAIDNALPQDRLEVGPGHYHETVLIDKSLSIQSVDPNDPNTPVHTVLIGDPTAPTLTLVGKNTDATIAGLTLSQGTTGLWCGIGVEATIHNCHMTDNTEAGMVCVASHPWIHHCIIAGNQGDGLSLQKHQGTYARPVLDNCTIVQNAGSGIFGGKPAITNSIVYFNGTDAQQIDAKSATVTYSCIQGDFNGKGNIDEDPCFVSLGFSVDPEDSDSAWIPGDYHLQSQTGSWDPASEAWIRDTVTSPCLDTGDPASPINTEPMPNGDRINMGAYGGTTQASKGMEAPNNGNHGGGGIISYPPWWPWPW